MRERYCLRKAAGSWWLLDLTQDGKHAVPPLELNGSAAQIWKMYQKGLEEEEIAARLADQFEVPQKEILEDIRQFFSMLRKN